MVKFNIVIVWGKQARGKTSLGELVGALDLAWIQGFKEENGSQSLFSLPQLLE